MFLDSLNIAGSGLTAQQQRLNIIAQNITNAETTRNESGTGPYRRQVAVLQSARLDGNGNSFSDYLTRASVYKRPNLELGYRVNNTEYQGSGKFLRNKYIGRNYANFSNAGVSIARIDTDPTPNKLVYNPEHPDANEEGYVEMPNVEISQEIVDSMAASRSFDANVQVINAIKAMASKALEIGR